MRYALVSHGMTANPTTKAPDIADLAILTRLLLFLNGVVPPIAEVVVEQDGRYPVEHAMIF